MAFNSIPFFVFFLLFFLFYWGLPQNAKAQNVCVLLGSYFFYAYYSYSFLWLLVFMSLGSFLIGIAISKHNKYQSLFLWVGILQGIGILFYYKYLNFFIGIVNSFLTKPHIGLNDKTGELIIPIGISFFIFRALGYLIDVYNGKIYREHNALNYFVYIAYFPCLLSGPIDKASFFLPQLETKRVFNYEFSVDGLRQILWGLFKKIVIADNCAIIADEIFAAHSQLPGSTLLIGTFFYTIQLYADFSGYSDMALGISKLLGINITKNFDNPYFSQNIAEYWRKWHMSLTSWLTEYIFTPLSILFRNFGKIGLLLAIIINFVICGLWHGANWTYVLFGLLHGLYFIPLIISGKLNKKIKQNKNDRFSRTKKVINIIRTFSLVMFATVLFRSESISDAISYYRILFSKSLFSLPKIPNIGIAFFSFIFLILMFLVEQIQKDKQHGLDINGTRIKPLFRGIIYMTLTLLILCFGGDQEKFIYFNF